MQTSGWSVGIGLCIIGMGLAGSVPAAEELDSLSALPDSAASESLSDLADDPIAVEMGITNLYQQNMRGGRSTHSGRGRFAGSYDVIVSADMERLLGIKGGELFIHVEGFWPKEQGTDPASVGSFFGVNGDAMPRDAAVVTELWYQQDLLEGDLLFRIGKMDLTGGFECSGCPVSFDCNRFANDETSQFLNSALVNNPSIPFSDYGLGAALHYAPQGTDWYITAASADAQADYRETGFRTAFHDEDYFFSIAETGITPRFNSACGPLQGTYRVGLWYSPRPAAHSDSAKLYRDNTGVYLSCDQMLVRENDAEGDEQGLGVFGRYGYAPSSRNDLTQYISVGLSYQGLFEGRDEDVLAIGMARGYLSDQANITYLDDAETVWEIFYNARITQWMNISPSLQYVADPGANSSAKDAVVFGLRTQLTF
ncbi:MAG: carbohydrate porin [Phycisphaerae bacterium]|nr:carbohydrate porin [Phycisphaerae bacterium]